MSGMEATPEGLAVLEERPAELLPGFDSLEEQNRTIDVVAAVNLLDRLRGLAPLDGLGGQLAEYLGRAPTEGELNETIELFVQAHEMAVVFNAWLEGRMPLYAAGLALRVSLQTRTD